ncbi:MAG TPA: hypothetical protein VK204_15360 [Nocardioidaceae bacterium]|nr:hypothetical protein [Nocardioidaceae bacterium]
MKQFVKLAVASTLIVVIVGPLYLVQLIAEGVVQFVEHVGGGLADVAEELTR